MAIEGKDRLGQKLHDVEAAREEQWARKRDDELLGKLRERRSEMVCPHCKGQLKPTQIKGIEILVCPLPEPDGAWVQGQALRTLIEHYENRRG